MNKKSKESTKQKHKRPDYKNILSPREWGGGRGHLLYPASGWGWDLTSSYPATTLSSLTKFLRSYNC